MIGLICGSKLKIFSTELKQKLGVFDITMLQYVDMTHRSVRLISENYGLLSWE